jgi:predicted nuclease with TOPRIM domain
MVDISEKALRDVKNQIKTLTRQARITSTVEEQHTVQEKIQELEREKRRMRQKIFDVEDEIYAKRDTLIDKLVKRIEQKTESEQLYTVHWKLI